MRRYMFPPCSCCRCCWNWRQWCLSIYQSHIQGNHLPLLQRNICLGHSPCTIPVCQRSNIALVRTLHNRRHFLHQYAVLIFLSDKTCIHCLPWYLRICPVHSQNKQSGLFHLNTCPGHSLGRCRLYWPPSRQKIFQRCSLCRLLVSLGPNTNQVDNPCSFLCCRTPKLPIVCHVDITNIHVDWSHLMYSNIYPCDISGTFGKRAN